MKRKTAIIGIVLACFCGVLLSGCGRQHVRETGPTLRILSYNIHHAEGVDGVLDVDRIADIICETGADLVGLNEVDKNWKRTDHVDQAKELAEILGMHYVFAPAIDENYGNAVLSRYPILSSTVHPLTPGNEPRVCIETCIDVDGTVVTFMATHLDNKKNTDLEVLDIVEIIKAKPPEEKIILTGDFNSEPASPGLPPLLEYLDDTYDTSFFYGLFNWKEKRKRIDYVFVSPNLSSGVQINRRPRTPLTKVASDHYPVYVELVLK